jgi:D-alanyl-D-alanine carboxypeptidase/D-alanyl-D-alanine-endopeptidase (penicillin-binding protein 4)
VNSRLSAVATLLLSIALSVFGAAHAQTAAGNRPSLPPAVADAFARAQVPLESVSVLVKEISVREPLLAANIERAMNPASVMKLVTTYAGLELLGPTYTWKTDVLVAGELRGGSLNGDLVLRGSGDPKLTVERLWLLLKQLRERGLRNISGDLVLDKSFFGPVDADPAKFDGEVLRAYNVGPDALLVNFKTIRFQFAPSVDEKSVSISPDVKPAQLSITNRTRLVEGPCGDWRERIKLDVQQASPIEIRVAFTGNYPKSCGESTWNISLLDHARFVGGVFANLWSDMGGIWKGAVKLAPTPVEARVIASTESAPLSEMVRDINKFSNNVMARQLFLTISGEIDKQPATTARSGEIVKAWIARKGIAAPELVMDNGSGLSRIERISASSLAQLLDAAFKSTVMPEFISSMSLIGLDGTFRRRARSDVVAGTAHLKSGTLNDVRALAGYVLANDGKRYIVVMLVNHPNAPMTQSAQDALLGWVYARNPVLAGPPLPVTTPTSP